VRARSGWLGAEPQSTARRLALLSLLPASWGYGAVARLHRSLHHRGWLRSTRLPCRVVSIGSLVAGGSGKTPAAAWLAAELLRRGHRVALASRGYGRAGRERVSVVSDGRFVHGRAETVGDEPMLLAARAPGVPVLVGRDRVLAGWRALSAFGAEVLVLDDGFQHYRLCRDIDIVVLDGWFGLGNARTLPSGPLREPVDGLRRADAIGAVDAPLGPRDEQRLERFAPEAFRFEAHRRPSSLRALRGGPRQSPEVLRGAEVGMLCGLARPASLRRSLEGLGARVVAERCFRDHHRYRPRDLQHLTRAAPLWITTEKDAGKIVPAWTGGVDLRVLSIEFDVVAPKALLDWIEARLRRPPPQRP
jgi:tetraacyldisaccharide 4'-kinase